MDICTVTKPMYDVCIVNGCSIYRRYWDGSWKYVHMVKKPDIFKTIEVTNKIMLHSLEFAYNKYCKEQRKLKMNNIKHPSDELLKFLWKNAINNKVNCECGALPGKDHYKNCVEGVGIWDGIPTIVKIAHENKLVCLHSGSTPCSMEYSFDYAKAAKILTKKLNRNF